MRLRSVQLRQPPDLYELVAFTAWVKHTYACELYRHPERVDTYRTFPLGHIRKDTDWEHA